MQLPNVDRHTRFYCMLSLGWSGEGEGHTMFMPTACGIFVKLFEIGKTADQTLHNSLAFDFKSYLRYFQIETCTHSNFDLTLFHARGSTPQVQ